MIFRIFWMLWTNKEDKLENCLVQQLQPPLLLLQQQEYQFHLAQCLDKAKQESFQLIVQPLEQWKHINTLKVMRQQLAVPMECLYLEHQVRVWTDLMPIMKQL
jgi:hypothetical protein